MMKRLQSFFALQTPGNTWQTFSPGDSFRIDQRSWNQRLSGFEQLEDRILLSGSLQIDAGTNGSLNLNLEEQTLLNTHGYEVHHHFHDLTTGEEGEVHAAMSTVIGSDVAVSSGSGGATLNTVNGVVFSHLAAGGGYAAFAPATGTQLGEEDYDSINDANINLTQIRFIGEVTVAGDIRFDFYDSTNTILQAQVTSTFGVSGPAFFTVNIPSGTITIPDSGVMRVVATTATANWWGSDATPTVGTESAGFGSLEFNGDSHNFELTNTSIDPDDYGDAPSPYPTLTANSGAVHTINALFLGDTVDGESDGQPSPIATADDDNSDDEDGVVFNDYFDVGTTVDVSITASQGGGSLNAWIDWNQNGSWLDAGEQVFTNQALSSGANSLTISVPAGATLGRTFGRFRLSTTTGLTPTGAAPDGEVEDHQILVENGGRRLTWSNRATTGDRFEEVFGGAKVNEARGVVDAVMRSWALARTDFNQPFGGDSIAMAISMASSGTGFGASAGVTSYSGGYPTSGVITISRGSDTTGDGNGDGAGFFVDPTPMDWSEFAGGVGGGAFVPYAHVGSPASGLSDLFTLVNAEITHSLGLFTFPAHMNNPVTGTINATGVTDDSEGGGVGTYFVFDGPSVTHLMTSNNGGGGGSDFGQAIHSAGKPAGAPNQAFNFNSAYRGSVQLVGADGPGNALYEFGRRYLVNDVMTLVFTDAFGYTSTLPQTFGTTYAIFDEATRDVLVRGGESGSADSISISSDGSDLIVSVDIGNDIQGTGPDGDSSSIAAFISRFSLSDVSSVTVEASDGNDTLVISPLVGIPISIDGGSPAFPNGGSGDELSFNVSGVSGAIFTDNGNGTGSLTSTSHATVSWSEIEVATAPVLPTIVASGTQINENAANRSGIGSLRFEFDQAVNAVDSSSLRLYNHTTDQVFDTSLATINGQATSFLTWDLLTIGTDLPDGRYTGEIAADQISSAGGQLTSTYAFDFHVMRGDLDGNAKVNAADFSVVGANFDPLTGTKWRDGDADGNGMVNAADFSVIGANFDPIGLADLPLDFGDASESGTSFPTTIGNDGARHVVGGLMLGTSIDAESVGQPTAAADGDDVNGDDEEAIASLSMVAGQTSNFTLVATVPGGASPVLNAWIDFNNDQDWDDAGEQVFVDEPIVNSSNFLSFAVPASASLSNVTARFRLTGQAGYSYSGLAADGEVEDYVFSIAASSIPDGTDPNDVTTPLTPGASITFTQLSDSQRRYFTRRFDRWNANFKDGLSEQRKHNIIFKQLNRVAQRTTSAADRYEADGKSQRAERMTELAAIATAIAEQLESDASRSIEDILRAWTV